MIWTIFVVSWALQDDPIVVEALKGYKAPWSDSLQGSAVTYREKTLRPELDAKGNFVLRETALDLVWSVVTVGEDKALVRVEVEGRESEITFFLGLPDWSRGKGERKGQEKIVVGNKTYDCAVTSISLDMDKDAGRCVTICRSPEAPVWAVRFRVETFAKGIRNTREEELLLAALENVKVGDRDVACQVVQVTTEAADRKIVKKEWRSDEVPGRLVRRETRYYSQDKEITSAFASIEVITFKIRK
jgi:hypothetical protein